MRKGIVKIVHVLIFGQMETFGLYYNYVLAHEY